MRWLSVAAHGRAGEVLLSLVLLTDTALLCVEVDMSARQRGAQAVLRPSVPIFALVYFAELLYKLHALGIARYASAPAHAFDGLVTLVSVGADILAVGPLAAKPRATRVALALRTLRLLRLFTTLRRFRSIFRRVVRLLPQLAGLFGAIWALFSVFAELGVLLFGGTLYAGDAWWHDHQTAEAQRYICCNFNDFGSAVVTLFELLIVNNWQEIMEEVVVVDGEWSQSSSSRGGCLPSSSCSTCSSRSSSKMSTPLHSEAVGDGLRGPTAAAYGTLATGAAGQWCLSALPALRRPHTRRLPIRRVCWRRPQQPLPALLVRGLHRSRPRADSCCPWWHRRPGRWSTGIDQCRVHGHDCPCL